MGFPAGKLKASLTASALFLAALLAAYVIHARYFTVDVVLYAALLDAGLATVLAGVVLALVPAFRVLGGFEKLLLVTIWMLAGYSFALSLPTVVDRSLSFYLLEKLQWYGGGIRRDALDRVVTEEFMQEYRVVDARLTEQLESGTLVIEDGCVRLTSKGQGIARISGAIRRHLLPKQRQILGEYTDQLTSPFENRSRTPGYACP